MFEPALDHLPSAQFKHVAMEAAPIVVEYVPAAHDKQVEIEKAVIVDE